MRHYYHNKHNYKALLLEASSDVVKFSARERNAILEAYYRLLCQNDMIYPFQKNVGNHPAEIILDVRNYMVYIGCDREKGCFTGEVYLELMEAPNNWTNEYHLFGDRPIRIIWVPNKYNDTWKYDWNTGEFVEGQEYEVEVRMNHGDTEEVSEVEFYENVDRLRGELGLYEQFQKKIEGIPSPEHMRDINRIAAIHWQEGYESHMWQVSLLHEFVRRIRRLGEQRACSSIWECIELLENDTREMKCNQGHSGRMLGLIENEWNRKICTWYVLWSGYFKIHEMSHTYITERNPFEPLVFLFERGVHFGQQENELLPFYCQEVFQLPFTKLPSFENRIFFDFQQMEEKEKKENAYFHGNPSIAYEKIVEFEKCTGRSIPFEYKEMLLLSNGGQPSPGDFYDPYTNTMACLETFFGIGNETYDLKWICEEYRSRIPNNLFPIARSGGRIICLGMSDEYDRKIYLWNSEEEEEAITEEQTNYSNVYWLADSLEDFTQKLR